MFRWFRASQPPPIVRTLHSSRGRLRVHLTHWSGQDAGDIVARLRRLPGVLDVQANGLTCNVLLLFHSRVTGPEELLRELERLPQAAAPVVAPPPATINGPTPVPLVTRQYHYVTGVRRFIYIGLGWASVGMAVVGFILPGIPGAPFVILAGYFFIRSSQPAHEWLQRSRWFGPMLRDWEEHHGIRRPVRNFAVGLIAFSAVFVSFLGLPLPILVSVWAMQFVGFVIVLRLRVIDPPAPALEFVP